MPADSANGCLYGEPKALHASGPVRGLEDPSRGQGRSVHMYCKWNLQRILMKEHGHISCHLMRVLSQAQSEAAEGPPMPGPPPGITLIFWKGHGLSRLQCQCTAHQQSL